MSFEERNQLKKEIVEKIIEANPEATPNYCIALLDEIKESVISAAMNSILTKQEGNKVGNIISILATTALFNEEAPLVIDKQSSNIQPPASFS